MLDAAKAVVRGKLIAVNVYIQKEERSKVNDLSFHIRKLEIEEQIKSEVSEENNS